MRSSVTIIACCSLLAAPAVRAAEVRGQVRWTGATPTATTVETD